MTINISEIFYSVQGEGVSIGAPALFVRLQGCNLTCTWCDTPYTWKPGQNKDFKRYQVSELVDEIAGHIQAAVSEPIVVITGGEPLLQQEQIKRMIQLLREREILVHYEIETNGTIFPHALTEFRTNIQLNVSPKLANSDVPKEKRFCREILELLASPDSGFRTFFKFVITNKTDFDEIFTDFDFIPREKMIIMPEGVTKESQVDGLSSCVEICKENGLRLIPRLHTLIWENRRGV